MGDLIGWSSLGSSSDLCNIGCVLTFQEFLKNSSEEENSSPRLLSLSSTTGTLASQPINRLFAFSPCVLLVFCDAKCPKNGTSLFLKLLLILSDAIAFVVRLCCTTLSQAMPGEVNDLVCLVQTQMINRHFHRHSKLINWLMLPHFAIRYCALKS